MEQKSNPAEEQKEKPKHSLFQTAVHYLTYPIAFATGGIYWHSENRRNIEEFYNARGDFKHLEDEIAAEWAKQKKEYNDIVPKEIVGELNRKFSEGKAQVLKDAKFKTPLDYYRANTPRGKRLAFVNGLGALAIMTGVGSFISQQQHQERHIAEKKEHREERQAQR